MKLTLSLSKAEAKAVLRAELSAGYGVKRSQSLRTAEFKIRQAIIAAQSESGPTADALAAERERVVAQFLELADDWDDGDVAIATTVLAQEIRRVAQRVGGAA